jgi:hypothetical protein
MKRAGIPADLATLAWAVPGQVVEVRGTLPGAGALARLLAPGSRLLCSGVEDDAVVIRVGRDLEIRIPIDRARLVQVERMDVGAPEAAITAGLGHLPSRGASTADV